MNEKIAATATGSNIHGNASHLVLLICDTIKRQQMFEKIIPMAKYMIRGSFSNILFGEWIIQIVEIVNSKARGNKGLMASVNVLILPVLSLYDLYMFQRTTGTLVISALTYNTISNINPADIPPGSSNFQASYPPILVSTNTKTATIIEASYPQGRNNTPVLYFSQ